MADKIKLVVLGEHTLGYLQPERQIFTTPMVNILSNIKQTQCLRGTTHRTDILAKYGEPIRLATAKDFDEFKVSFVGFDNDAIYEFAKN